MGLFSMGAHGSTFRLTGNAMRARKAKEYTMEQDALSSILEHVQIRTVFQPIVSLENGSTLGYEALSRGPCGSQLESPCALFEEARAQGRIWDLDTLCRRQALLNASRQKPDGCIFINVDPHVINDEKFRKGFTRVFLEEYGMDPQNIVLEITEDGHINDIELFKTAVEHYRQQGYRIAIDDTGTGYSGLKLISDLHPQYIKLDMVLIRGIENDNLKQALVKAMCDFCRAVNIRVIAEGIESENELRTLIHLGAHYGQGYLIGRPDETIKPASKNPVDYILECNEGRSSNHLKQPSMITVGSITLKNRTVPPEISCQEAYRIFESSPHLYGIPVVDDDLVVKGLITRNYFYARLGSQYGYDLYIRRPVKMLMDAAPLIVNDTDSIEAVARLAMMRNHEKLYNYIIVEKEGRYLGVVSVKDLLEKAMDVQVRFARHLNPLSGMPGNLLIQQRMQDCIDAPDCETVFYIDIDNFKAYNDVYGFESGDRMILHVANILQQQLERCGVDGAFAGHIGGDDFIFISNCCDPEATCRQIIERFEANIPDFYTQQHIDANRIFATGRNGEAQYFDIASLSVAAVRCEKARFTDYMQLSEHATLLKKKCKEQRGSAYIVN